MKIQKEGRLSKKKLTQEAKDIERDIGLRFIGFMLRFEMDMERLEMIGEQIEVMNARKLKNQKMIKRPKNAKRKKRIEADTTLN